MAVILREYRGLKLSRTRHIRLIGNAITIGRSDDCDFTLEKIPYVSRCQCTLKRDSDGWWLIDGEVGRPSAAGIHVGDRRVYDSIPIEPHLRVLIFNGASYKVELEVVDVSDSEIGGIERDTAEVPLFMMSEEIAALHRSVDDLRAEVKLLATQVHHSDPNGAVMAELRAMRSEFNDRFEKLEHKDSHHDDWLRSQDKKQNRLLVGLAAALVVTGGAAAGLSPDAIGRVLGVFNMIAGAGSVTLLRSKNSD
jgi:hypothetical protein